ncbi:hypothetical protein GPJ56_008076 [Histomonas meleagridis]|uniref:uncharacterized protein n=1 Tax=Histomonas meleagridis TaxID=135588 RepID=UPI00355979CB|nr:hypothetical protein GPJ56_008076 [Histomonas meleagridis]KAH0798973.1 hypothetical protein GO595_008263 [Histomonas meleagridis]
MEIIFIGLTYKRSSITNSSAQQSKQITSGHSTNPSAQQSKQSTGGHNPSSSSTGQITGGYNPSKSFNSRKSKTTLDDNKNKKFGTTITIKKDNKIIEFRPDLNVFKRALNEANGKPVLFITMCGSFQVGKSSTIKKLSGEKSVEIGNGSEEQTKGAYVYGPFPYNYIRKRFGMDEVQDNDTQIFFVDTEGCNGFDTGDTNVEANTFLLSQLIAPYAALSNVLVTLMDKNIRLQEVQANGTLFRIIREVRKGTVDTHFLGVVQNYIIKDDPFDEMRQKVTKIMRKRFGEQSELQDFIPLPFFDPRYDILNQDKKFNDGFNEFAKILLNSLEESRQKCIIDAESAYNMFETLVKRTEDQDLQQLVQKAIENGELSAAERLCLGDVNRIIESKTSIIQKSIKELQDQLKKNPFFEIPQIEIKQNICDAAFHEMESFPESV